MIYKLPINKLVIRIMENKTTIEYHYTSICLAKNKKIDNINIGEVVQ